MCDDDGYDGFAQKPDLSPYCKKCGKYAMWPNNECICDQPKTQVLKLKHDITGRNPILPETKCPRTICSSRAVLFVASGKRYAGHYHSNGYFYTAERLRYADELFYARGPNTRDTGFSGPPLKDTPVCTSWEYIQE